MLARLVKLICILTLASATKVSEKEEVSITEAIYQIENNAEQILFGDYEICDWEIVQHDDTVPLTIDGLSDGFLHLGDDILIEGWLCDSDVEVVLVLDDRGLHGSILHEDMSEVILSVVDKKHSSVKQVQHTHQHSDESATKRAADEKWRAHMNNIRKNRNRRRSLQDTPQDVDIHLQLDIDKHMVDTFHSDVLAAARYGVELVAIVNRDAYQGLGFNLKVVSINVRTDEYLHNSANSERYLTAISRVALPPNVHLIASLTTREVGGGIAYLGGLYNRNPYSVSGDLTGEFSHWDRVMLAHELGHNFGADHTHEMRPPIDRCGDNRCDDPISTIMSYCDFCPGGSSNIRYEFHPRVITDIHTTYSWNNYLLSSTQECFTMPALPDTGVPIYFRGSQCLEIDTSNCADCNVESCELDSIWVLDESSNKIISAKDENYCWSSTDCASITLELCSSSTMQQFLISPFKIEHSSCGIVSFTGTSIAFSSEAPLANWCFPDNEVTDFDDRNCVDTRANPQTINCGEEVNGSNRGDCDGVSYFSFTPEESGTMTISTCNSNFDTTLVVQTDTVRVATGDDEGMCGYQTVLSDLNLDGGVSYQIAIAGYAGATGDYWLSVTCDEPQAPPEPSNYECMFGTCDVYRRTCHNDHRIATGCAYPGDCDLANCQSTCDANENCEYFFSRPGRHVCWLFDSCDRTQSWNQESKWGYTRDRLEPGETVEPTSLPPTNEPTRSPTKVPTQGPTFITVGDATYGCVADIGCERTSTTCASKHQVNLACDTKNPCDLEACYLECNEEPECRYIFSNSRGVCDLFNSCSQKKHVWNGGFLRECVSCSPTPTVSYECMYGCEQVFTTCSMSSEHGQKLEQLRGKHSLQECENACTANDECMFIFRNKRSKCTLFSSCNEEQDVSTEGVTKKRIAMDA